MNNPPLIYRFRPLDESVLERELIALSEGYLFAPLFSQMNDPMEAFYEIGGGEDQHLQTAYFEPRGGDINDIYRIFSEQIDKFAVVSFSDTYKNFPMWAYYASNFAGLCLEFDSAELSIGDLENEELHPVDYAESALPTLTFADFGT